MKSIMPFLEKQSISSLYGYLVICVGCMIAMLVNLAVQQVGFSALFLGSGDEKKLLILTIAVVTFCALMIVVLLQAVGQKRETQKYTKSAVHKKKR